MANTVQIWLPEEQQELLKNWGEKNGYDTLGKAAKALLLQALDEEKTQSKMDEWLEKIETHVARAASRGTHASLASLCLQTAKANSDLAEKLESMTAAEQFDYAWDMANPMMKAGTPDFYRSTKHAHIQHGLRKKESDELLKVVAEGHSPLLILKLDEDDIAPWFEAMEGYRRTHKFMAEHSQGEEGWFSAYLEANQSERVLRNILDKMGIDLSNVNELFTYNTATFSNEFGWQELPEEDIWILEERKVYDYSPIKDYLDDNAWLFMKGIFTWDEAREKGLI